MAIYKILLVEDNEGWNEYLCDCLREAVEEAGHEADIHGFQDSEVAWKVLKNERWNLVVTDINLKGPRKIYDKFGIQLTQLAQEQEVPCIAISGDPIVEPEDVRAILKTYSAYDFVGKKHFDRYGFKKIVQEAMGISTASTDVSRDGPTGSQATDDVKSLTQSWQDILNSQGTYYCYAFFLILPADKEAIEYITEQGAELDLISRDRWFIIALSERQLWGSGFSRDWAKKIKRYVYDGFSVKVAQMLKVDLTEFPCLVLFQDIDSARRIVVTLKGLSAAEIGATMRSVAKFINDAAMKDEDPLIAVQNYLNREARRKTGKAIAGKVTVLAGKTFEEGIKILISELGTMIRG